MKAFMAHSFPSDRIFPHVVRDGVDAVARFLSRKILTTRHIATPRHRSVERNNLADKLTVEAKALADLKIEKAAVEGERRTVEADLGPVNLI
jgi:hypothetical protein